jgi:hypothetical protein
MRLPLICHTAIIATAFAVTSACTGTATPTPAAASQSIEHARPPAPAEAVSGTIARFSGTCPTVTFTVDATSVVTSASTIFGASSCGALANGMTIIVEGRVQQGGILLATSLRILPPPVVTVRGVVSGVAAACPTLTFLADGRTIATTPGTKFSGGTCVDIANGVQVSVDGTVQHGVISASSVHLTIPLAEITGTISALA